MPELQCVSIAYAIYQRTQFVLSIIITGFSGMLIQSNIRMLNEAFIAATIQKIVIEYLGLISSAQPQQNSLNEAQRWLKGFFLCRLHTLQADPDIRLGGHINKDIRLEGPI